MSACLPHRCRRLVLEWSAYIARTSTTAHHTSLNHILSHCPPQLNAFPNAAAGAGAWCWSGTPILPVHPATLYHTLCCISFTLCRASHCSCCQPQVPASGVGVERLHRAHLCAAPRVCVSQGLLLPGRRGGLQRHLAGATPAGTGVCGFERGA